MAENRDKEHSEEPTGTHSESISNDIIFKKDPEAINPNQETENMEVHHHAHHRGKKNWKSYFWEFLMLFLAVTLGFFVENQREHYIENLRAKEFSKSLIKDLQSDITAIQRNKKTASMYIALADSLINLSQTRLEDRASAQFSFYTRFMYWTGSVVWNRATFEQIKNSGSLRYFKNQHLLEKLMKYDGIINDIEMESYNHQVRGNLLVNHINQIIEPAYHRELSRYFLFSYDTISRETIENLYPANPESLENKRSEIKALLNMVVVQQRNLRNEIEGDWPQAEAMANELINDFKIEYHIE
ncbi:MAG: hypothetical protein SH856_02930 [Flavobacteriales bacterium]|nr:hypothetical protein [Flavobacteriales bacterium]